MFGIVFWKKNYSRAKTIRVQVKDFLLNNKITFEKNICSRTIFKIEQRTRLRNGFSNRRRHFEIVILGLVDVIFYCGHNYFRH